MTLRESFFYCINRHRGGLDAKRLMDDAMASTGLSDWGGAPFEEPFYILLESLEREAKLSHQGRFTLSHHFSRLLRNLLLLAEEWKRNPAIQQTEITPPLFVIGLPRTGTTYLHTLLSLDPENRALRYWELLFPSPAPKPMTYANDPRIRKARYFTKGIDVLAPKLARIHPLRAESAEECCFIFDHLFLDSIHHPVFDVPQYIAYYLKHDPAPSYRFHHAMLKHYARGWEFERFVLKAPRHLFCLEALLNEYPEAPVIWTHRDAAQAAPSLCSLSETARRIVSDEIDLHRIGRLCMEHRRHEFEAGMKAKSGAGNGQILDVEYDDLIHAPVELVQWIYQHFGLNYTDAFDMRLREHAGAESRKRRVKHEYSMERYGLEAKQMDREIR